jgi:hypothetical protein
MDDAEKFYTFLLLKGNIAKAPPQALNLFLLLQKTKNNRAAIIFHGVGVTLERRAGRRAGPEGRMDRVFLKLKTLLISKVSLCCWQDFLKTPCLICQV